MTSEAPENSVNTATYWLARADSAREAAGATKDLRLRRHLLGSADGYEKIAQDVAAEPITCRKSTGRPLTPG
jgi:hypothetical protein